MTDTTTDVKEFLRSKIAEMTQQLRKITDAEDVAATHTLVGRCYVEMVTPVDRTKPNNLGEPAPWKYVKFVSASGGELTVMTIKMRSDDVLSTSQEHYRSALSMVERLKPISEDEFAYALRERLSAILKQATGQTYRFEVIS